MLRRFLLFAVLLLVMVVAVACGSNEPAATATPVPAVEPTDAPEETAVEPAVEPTAVPEPEPTEAPADDMHDDAMDVAFDAVAAEEEGYWYSRYNLGNLVMRSGMGDTFMPEMDMVMAMVGMVDANPDDGDTVAPPVNPALLRSVYASGDPHYATEFDVDDFGAQRWDPSTFDTTITSRAMGWTMLKEAEWGKQFHVDNHFGTIDDDFGAQQRFAGIVLVAESKMQGQYAMEMLMNEDGFIADSDGNVDFVGQWVMLEAFSDLGGLLSMENIPNSATNRYFNADESMMFIGGADMLFMALADRQPESIEELSLAIQALTWYATNTANHENAGMALDLIAQFGDELGAAEAASATENALAIRGLVEAYRMSGDEMYLETAVSAFEALAADYNPDHGVFSSQNSYTIDDIGVIMGGLNSIRLFAGDAIDQAMATDIFSGFYESAVNKSGLQLSVPPIPVAKGEYEQDEPEIFYGYPTMVPPPMAGGDFGIAPVFATEVTFDGGEWSITDAMFDSAGAMHASNEFIWFHNDEVNGFPDPIDMMMSDGHADDGMMDIPFDAVAAEEEGYWYSRYNLGNLVMRSGMGDTFMPEMEMVMAMVGMVDANPDDGDTVAPPVNPALLRSVYASGDPHYATEFDVDDFGAQRWDPATFDTTITSRAMGWTMLKEAEWGKQFHVDNHFGTIDDDFGAQQRFAGIVLVAESKMQGQYAMEMLMNDDGFIADSDGNVDFVGQWVMLEAFSDLGGLLSMENVPNSATNRYFNLDESAMFLGAADNLFAALADRQPESTEELSLAMQSLVWYAINSENEAQAQQAFDLIEQFGDELAAADAGSATDSAFAIRGLIEAYRMTQDSDYLDAAAAAFDDLAAGYNPNHGVFSNQDSYTIDDIGVIMGGLNSIRLYGGDAIDQAMATDIFSGFYESAVNQSGLQLSVPPIPVAKGEYEQDEPEIFYGYPTMVPPPMAGGDFGIAPVFATEVTFDSGMWSITNAMFDSAGAMHASNEFIWFHNDEVNGFPELN